MIEELLRYGPHVLHAMVHLPVRLPTSLALTREAQTKQDHTRGVVVHRGFRIDLLAHPHELLCTDYARDATSSHTRDFVVEVKLTIAHKLIKRVTLDSQGPQEVLLKLLRVKLLRIYARAP